MIRQASETGQLFGSVSPRDIAALLTDDGAEVDRTQIALNAPIKTIGQHKVPLALHPEVEVSITVNVARSADEAERIARGEDVTVRRAAMPKRKRRPPPRRRGSLLRAGRGRGERRSRAAGSGGRC